MCDDYYLRGIIVYAFLGVEIALLIGVKSELAYLLLEGTCYGLHFLFLVLCLERVDQGPILVSKAGISTINLCNF